MASTAYSVAGTSVGGTKSRALACQPPVQPVACQPSCSDWRVEQLPLSGYNGARTKVLMRMAWRLQRPDREHEMVDHNADQ